MQETMNVHKALCEIKLLNSKITKAINEAAFCRCNVVTNKKIDGKTVEMWEKDAQSAYTSISTLIARRNALKSAINQSNAVTKITVGEKEYTVAEAIELKQYGMDYYKQLMSKLAIEFNTANGKVTSTNESADEKATKHAENCVTGDKSSPEVLKELEAIRSKYYDNHKAELIDPIKAMEKVKEIDTFVSNFMSDVDSAISVANATTTITVEY